MIPEIPKNVRALIFAPAIAMAVGMAPGAYAQEAEEPQPALVVGVKQAPPFAIPNGDGSWSGIAIDLWRTIADDMGLRYELQETTLEGLLQGVASGEFAAGVAAITITAEREKSMDFTQPYSVAGLGIAVPADQDAVWLDVLRRIFSPAFLKAVLALLVLLLAAGLLLWLFERRHNQEQFGKGEGRGIFAGFWWAAVTMTTVGYGDKAPVTVAGRIIGLIWMFTSVIVISSFTAAIASSITIGHLEGPVQGIADLPGAAIGTVRGSTSAEYLKQEHLPFTGYDTALAALQALNRGKLAAVVFDAPILRYQISRQFRGRLLVLPVTFDEQYYGIALPPGSDLREPLDRRILKIINSPQWPPILAEYLGE